MIELNLLPQDLRSRKQIVFNLDKIIYFSKIGFLILIGIHILLLFICLFYKFRADAFSKEWGRISSQNADVLSLRNEISVFEKAIENTDKLTRVQFPWTHKLGKLNSLLPNGVWFKHIRVAAGSLDITGSVISRDKDEVEIINNFLQDLKKDSSFYAGFKNLDVVSIVRSNLFGVEVINFSIRGVLE